MVTLTFGHLLQPTFTKKGLAAWLSVSQVKEPRSNRIPRPTGHTEQNRMVLLKLGVPAGVIQIFGNENNSTRKMKLLH